MSADRRAVWTRALRAARGAALRVALGVGLGASPGLHAQTPAALPAYTVPGTQMRADGIPEHIPRPRAAQDAVPPAPGFVAWHPHRPQMLVLTRLGTTRQLHVLEDANARPRPLTRGRDAVFDARWEPQEAQYAVFRRDEGGDEAWRLYRIDDQAGAEPVLVSTLPGRVSEFAFMPGGRGLVYILERLDRQAREGEDERAAHSWLVWVDPKQPESPRTLLNLPGVKLRGLTLTADGGLTVFQGQGRGDRGFRLLFGPDLGRPERLNEPTPGAVREGEPVQWGWRSSRTDFLHLVRTGEKSNRRESLLTDIPADVEGLAVPSPEGPPRPLVVVHNEGGLSVLRLFDPAAPQGELRRMELDLPPGVVRRLAWHPRLPLLAIEHVSAHHAGRLYVYDHSSRQLHDWSGRPPPSRQVPEFALLRWKSFDGLEITGWHVAPPARFEGPRPVLIHLHGGPVGQSRPGSLGPLERWAVEELGMHLVMPNVRGSDGFGQRFRTLDDGRRREDAVKDVSALLDLVARTPSMRADRVVVEGGSYGGYMALAVAVHEAARIAGAICSVGIANFVTFLEQTESYRRENRRQEYGDERDPQMREFLTRISPVTRAAEIRNPLLVVHGRNDPRVPYGEAEQIVRAVRANGVPVWFLTADDEGHGFRQAANATFRVDVAREFLRRIVDGRPLQP